MRLRLFSCLNRQGVAWLLAAGLASTAGWAVAAEALQAPPTTAAPTQGTAAPPFVRQALPEVVLAGEGELRFWGLRIYGARLWVGPQFDAADFATHPLALELVYHRAFSGASIAQRSIEEIQRQRSLTPAQAQRWQQALSKLLPDVQPGERLTGVYQPGQGLQLWHGSQWLGVVQDAELARWFFSIWLSPSTSDPGLRSALLARYAKVAP